LPRLADKATEAGIQVRGSDRRGFGGTPGRLAFASVLLLGLATLPACRRAVLALGDTPGEAAHNGGELVGALASRVGPLQRDAAFAVLRPKLSRAALVPSRAFDDPSVWTRAKGPSRELAFGGARDQGRYRVGTDTTQSALEEPADYSGLIKLTALRPGEYEWRTKEELALGPVLGGDLERAVTELFSTLENVGKGDLRERVRAELPGTAAALAPLLSLEELQVAPSGHRSSSLTLVASMNPAGITKPFPGCSRFLRRHVLPLRFHVTAFDESGSRWWEMGMRDGRLLLRLNVRGGSLSPLDGPPRRIPRWLRLEIDLTKKAGWFRVGVRGLVAHIALTSTPHERGFVASFPHEPDWVIPFTIQPFLRTSLRRPFLDDGWHVAGAVLDGDGTQTRLVRSSRLAVRESWIVGWLGGVLRLATADFLRGAEREVNQFKAAVLLALRADMLALTEVGAGVPAGPDAGAAGPGAPTTAGTASPGH